MAKVILICGKICSGKSYYAAQLKRKLNTVILSCDEILFALSLHDIAELHDDLVSKIKNYFNRKTVEIVNAGTNVILDSGFWSKQEREITTTFFSEHNIAFEWHYIDVSDSDWEKNINERNYQVVEHNISAYYLDEGLLGKLNSIFEIPSKNEIDVWVENSRE